MGGAGESLRLAVTVPAEVSQLRFMTEIVRVFLSDGLGIGPENRDHQQLQLAIREASSNVIRHAYADRRPGPLRLRLWAKGGCVHVRIEDRGRPIPEETIQLAETVSCPDPSELAEGGYGLALIRDTMSGVAYRKRKNGINALCMHKKFSDAA